ncbi:MAG: response regulator [Planctomycetes bacterium]|nr:response regulator [Planctomycetota bacterium]
MSLARWCALLALCSTLAIPGLAQERRAAQVTKVWSATAKGTTEWFHHGFELAFAQANVDMRQAIATGQQLWAEAEQAPPGAAAACAAMLGYLVTRGEGPVAAREWVQRAETLPSGSSPVLAAYAALARARERCANGDHAGELEHALRAMSFAEQADDEVLRVRGTWATLHGRPAQAVAAVEKVFADAAARGRAAQVEFLRGDEKFFLLHHARVAQDRERVATLLQELDRWLAAEGDVRLLAAMHTFRISLMFDGDNAAEAMDLYAESTALFREVGDRFDIATALDLQAWLAVRSDQLELAKKLVDECVQLVEGRGMAEAEKELLQTRFELAVRMRDGETAEKLSHQLDQLTRERVTEGRQLAQAQERLQRAEEARQAAEKAHAEAMAQEARRVWRMQWLAGLAALVAMAGIAGVAWFSRRRLFLANKQLEEQVRAVQQAQQAQHELEARLRQIERTESLGTMAAGIAHDFNNLLTSMLGGAEMLEQQAERPAQRELTQMIIGAGRQGARLCKQLQAYAGGVPPAPIAADLHEVVRDMLPTLRASVGGGVELRLTIDSVAATACVDRAQFEQMLLNLVQNSQEAGARSVRVRVAPADGEPASGALLEVADDGAGVEPELAQRIFDPFFTTKFPGRGLGLAVVHGVVRRHGGTITVHSEVGAGTTFKVWLPGARCEASPLPSMPPATLAKVPTGLVTLVVDDEANVREVLARFLRQTGNEVLVAASGEAALQLARGLPPGRVQVAFVDLTMPGIDGIAVVEGLRAGRLVDRIVLMSGHAGVELERLAREVGCDSWLHKPFLVGDVRSVLGSLGLRQPAANERLVKPEA